MKHRNQDQPITVKVVPDEITLKAMKELEPKRLRDRVKRTLKLLRKYHF